MNQEEALRSKLILDFSSFPENVQMSHFLKMINQEVND